MPEHSPETAVQVPEPSVADMRPVPVALWLPRDTVTITATSRSADRTGVEMEALTAVAVAGLTLHDMIKALDPAATLDAVRLERKEGGRSGVWTRPDGR